MKIEKGNQLFVKVGGGFIPVKEFVEKYTQQEVEKIDRRDVKERIGAKLKMVSDRSRKSLNSRHSYDSRSAHSGSQSRSKRNLSKGMPALNPDKEGAQTARTINSGRI